MTGFIFTHIVRRHGEVLRLPGYYFSNAELFSDGRQFEYSGLYEGDEIICQPVKVESHRKLDHHRNGD